jgi:hypothetical protein
MIDAEKCLTYRNALIDEARRMPMLLALDNLTRKLDVAFFRFSERHLEDDDVTELAALVDVVRYVIYQHKQDAPDA